MIEKNAQILKQMTVYIAYPTGDRYIEVKSPICIDARDGGVSVVASNGTIYTAHVTNILIITKPIDEKENTND